MGNKMEEQYYCSSYTHHTTFISHKAMEGKLLFLAIWLYSLNIINILERNQKQI